MRHSVITLAYGGERSRVIVLSSWRARMRGLLGRAQLRRDVGVLIHPCNAVHTVGMQFALDVVFFDRKFNVLRVVSGLRSQRFAFCLGAFAAMECAARPDEPVATLSRRANEMAQRLSSIHSTVDGASSASSTMLSRGRLSMSNTDT